MPSETVADGSHRVPRQHRILASRFKGKLVPCGTRQADRGGEFKTVKLVSTNFLHYPVATSSAPKKKPKNNLTGRGRYPRLRGVVFRRMCRSLNSVKPLHIRLSVRSLPGVYRSEDRDNGLLRPCCPRCPSCRFDAFLLFVTSKNGASPPPNPSHGPPVIP